MRFLAIFSVTFFVIGQAKAMSALYIRNSEGQFIERINYDETSFEQNLRLNIYCSYIGFIRSQKCVNEEDYKFLTKVPEKQEVAQQLLTQATTQQQPVPTIPATQTQAELTQVNTFVNAQTPQSREPQVVYKVIERAVPGPQGPAGKDGRDGKDGTTNTVANFFPNTTSGSQYIGYGSGSANPTGNGNLSSLSVTGDSSFGGKVAGAGLISCNSTTSKILYNSTTGQFECGTDQSGGISSVNTNFATATIGIATLTSATSTNLFTNVINAITSTFTSLFASTAYVTTLNSTTTNASTSNFVTANGTTGNINTINSVTGNFKNINATGTTQLTSLLASTTNASTSFASTTYATNLTVSGSSTLASTTIANFTAQNGNVTALDAGSTTVSGILSAGNIFAVGSSTLGSTTFTNASGNNFSINQLLSATGTVNNLNSTSLFGDSLVSNLANIISSTIMNLIFTNATGTNATTTNFFTTNFLGTNITSSGNFALATGTIASTTITQLNAINASITTLHVDNFSPNVISVNLATFTSGTATNWFANTASASNLFASNATFSYATVTNGFFTNLSVTGPVSAALNNGFIFRGATSNFSEATSSLFVANTSYIGVGTTTPLAKLTVSGDTSFGWNNSAIVLADTALSGNTFSLGSLSGFGFLIRDQNLNQDRFLISSAGNIGIATTSPTQKLSVEGNALITGNIVNPRISDLSASADGADVYLCISTSGQVVLDCSGNYSDIRLKKNIATVTDALDKVKALNTVNYSWIDEKRGTSSQIGYIAQDVQKVIPEAIKTDSNGILKVKYDVLSAIYANAIKELDEKVFGKIGEIFNRLTGVEEKQKELEDRIKVLENRLNVQNTPPQAAPPAPVNPVPEEEVIAPQTPTENTSNIPANTTENPDLAPSITETPTPAE